MNQRAIPDDFPRVSSLGTVAGAQPKLLVRKLGNGYISGPTEAEVWERYDACEDLAQQLAPYTSRKMSENGWSPEETLSRVRVGVTQKVRSGQWDLSPDEIAWMMNRVREVLSSSSDIDGLGPDAGRSR